MKAGTRWFEEGEVDEDSTRWGGSWTGVCAHVLSCHLISRVLHFIVRLGE